MERVSEKGSAMHAPAESKVVIIDDNATLREATTAELKGAGFHVEAFAAGKPFVDGFNVSASCILLELRLRDVSGIEVLKTLNESMTFVPVVAISSNIDIREVVEVMRAGAHNVLERPTFHNVLIDSVRLAIAQYGLVSTIAPELILLSHREREALRYLLNAKSTKDIAHAFAISPKTAEKHRGNILDKLNVESQAELLVKLLPLRGLVPGWW